MSDIKSKIEKCSTVKELNSLTQEVLKTKDQKIIFCFDVRYEELKHTAYLEPWYGPLHDKRSGNKRWAK